MNGNMLSRWTDFLHSDGEKEWRNRYDEFINTLKKNYSKCLGIGMVLFIRSSGYTKRLGFNQRNFYSQYGSISSSSIASSTSALCITFGTNYFYWKNGD